MKKNKYFLMPNRKKILLFITFALITTAGIIQHSPITETPPAPMSELPSKLGNLNLTFLYLLLAFPYYIPLFIIGLTNVLPTYNFPIWLILGGNTIYLYFLSCALISSIDRYKNRFSIWHWAIIISLSISPVLFGLYNFHITLNRLDDLLFYLFIVLIIVIYFIIFISLGFVIYDRLKRIKYHVE